MTRQALVLLLVVGALVFPVRAEVGAVVPEAVSAARAAGRMLTPTFRQVHEAFTRLVVNESGFKSISDQEGILEALLFDGGGRVAGRTGRGTGHGLDYTKIMARMVTHSPRTFPVDSGFLAILSPERMARAMRLRTHQNEWVSTLRLDCSQPSGWNESISNTWRGFSERCPALVASTERLLKGEVDTHCDGHITTWGSYDDRQREGGALDSGWSEAKCDRPPLATTDPPMEECHRLREDRWSNPEINRRLLNSTNCARNYFFSWIEVE